MDEFLQKAQIVAGVLAAIVVILLVTSSSTATTTSPSSNNSGPLKVISQSDDLNAPSQAAGSVLQPNTATLNDPINTSPACQRGVTQQALLQGGACSDQTATKQLLNQ